MKTKFKIFMLKLKRIFFKVFLPCFVSLIIVFSSCMVVSAEETLYPYPIGITLFNDFNLYREAEQGGLSYAIYKLYDTPGSDFLTYPVGFCFPNYISSGSSQTQNIKAGISDNDGYTGGDLFSFFEQGCYYRFTFILRLNNRPSNENINNHFAFILYFGTDGVVVPNDFDYKGAYYEPSIAGYDKDGVKVTTDSWVSADMEIEYPINSNLSACAVTRFDINDNYANVDYYRLTFTIHKSNAHSPSVTLQFREYMREIKTTDGEVADFIVNGGHAEPPYPNFEHNETVDNAISSEEEILDATAGYRQEGKDLLDSFADLSTSGPINRGIYFYSLIINRFNLNSTLFNIFYFSLALGVVGFLLSIPTLLKGGKK